MQTVSLSGSTAGLQPSVVGCFRYTAMTAAFSRHSRGQSIGQEEKASQVSLLSLRGLLLCVFTAVLLLSTLPAYAAKDALLDEAAEHLRNRNPQQAYALLEPHEPERAGDPDFDLAFGVAANQTGHFTRAIMALERVLITDPDRLRAKTELATAYFAVRDNQRARRLLQEAKQQKGIPNNIARTIDRFMRTIDRFDENHPNTRFNYTGHVQLSVGHDSNVASSPEQTTFNIPKFQNLPFSLADDATRKSSSFATLDAGLSGRYNFNHRLSWVGAVGISHTGNTAAGADDVTGISFSTGPAWLRERHELSLAFQGGSSWLDGSHAMNTFGLTGNWIYRPTGFNQLSTWLQHLKRHDRRSSNADTDRTVLGVTYSHMFRSAFFAFGGVYLAREEPEDSSKPQLGHDAKGIRMGLQYNINPKLAVYFSTSYEDRQFGGMDALFLRTRADHQTNASFGINWTPRSSIVVSPSISYTRSRSNISLHSFKRKRFSLSTRYVF